ncbi:sn-glycerol-3-phosphate ABC transporter ATP-binding protein UgpC [candidate division WOR-3 bacterium]|nr:sn-glycerol-3-phosphate ABC transporter ATP-binding protein UgpC [candidate division WOR-3 bacterium]
MASLRLNNVSKVYGKDVQAVHNVNCEIHDREFAVLVGPSGCGKTTILRCIAGLEEVSNGEIYIDDRCVNDIPPKERDIAMVFQNYALYPHMTVYDNMAFSLKMRKCPKKEIAERVHETATILGIEDLLTRRPRQLSGGQRQRVAVGRAIVRQPKLFLFDEPLSNLDAKLRVQMRAELSRLHQRFQTTIVYVTHDQVEAMTLGQTIIVLKDGTVQQIADPITLYKKPKNAFIAGFIGSPPMNFIPGTIMRSEKQTIFTNNEIRIPIERSFSTYVERDVILGIRPSDFSVEHGAMITLDVDVVEPMGSEVYVYGRSGKSLIAARLTTDNLHPEAGEQLTLKVDTSKIYLFDAKTEKTLF